MRHMQLNQTVILTILYFNSSYFLRNHLCLDLYLPTLIRIIMVLLSIWNRVSLRKGNKKSLWSDVWVWDGHVPLCSGWGRDWLCVAVLCKNARDDRCKLKYGRLHLCIGKNISCVRVTEHWQKVPGEVVEWPFQEIFRRGLGTVLRNLWYLTVLWVGWCTRWPSEFPCIFSSSYSVICLCPVLPQVPLNHLSHLLAFFSLFSVSKTR